jgi:hypothetical protein
MTESFPDIKMDAAAKLGITKPAKEAIALLGSSYSGSPSSEGVNAYSGQTITITLAENAPQTVTFVNGGAARFTVDGKSFKLEVTGIKPDGVDFTFTVFDTSESRSYTMKKGEEKTGGLIGTGYNLTLKVDKIITGLYQGSTERRTADITLTIRKKSAAPTQQPQPPSSAPSTPEDHIRSAIAGLSQVIYDPTGAAQVEAKLNEALSFLGAGQNSSAKASLEEARDMLPYVGFGDDTSLFLYISTEIDYAISAIQTGGAGGEKSAKDILSDIAEEIGKE